MACFNGKTYELDCSIHAAISNIVCQPISPRYPAFSMREEANNIHRFLKPEQFLETHYFKSVTLPFRFLRHCLHLHLVNHTDEESGSTVYLPEEDKEDLRPSEKILFFPFFVAPVPSLTESTRIFRGHNSNP